MNCRSIRSVIALAVLSCVAAGTALAQSGSKLSAGPAYTSKDGKDGPKFPSVDVVVRLSAASGAPIKVQPSDLKVNASGKEAAIGSSFRTFSDAGYGVKSILALDLSGSMSGAPLEAIRNTIARFVTQARTQDRVEVLTIADDTRIEVPFGADKAQLAERLRQVKSRGSLTRLYDGILEGLKQLEGAPPVYRQLTVISDGHDEGSQHTLDDVIRQAVKMKVPIDSIGMTREHPEYLQSLTRLSQATGGGFRQAKSPAELDGLIDQGIQGLRATPVVAFKLIGVAGDGKAHTLDLHWKPENLAATVDINAPSMPNRWSLWVWVLGACFVAGLLLLIFARRGLRKQAKAAPGPAQGPRLEQPAPPPSLAAAPVHSSVTAVEAGRAAPAPARVPTRIEEAAEPRQSGRAQTRMAAFFEQGPGRAGATLEAIDGPLAGQTFSVTGELTIGAVPGNGLEIGGDPTLSSFHARVRLMDAVLTIEDQHSTNGTWVNGTRLGQDRKLLRAGDEIRVGKSVFKVREG